jgi:hypothetical protein
MELGLTHITRYGSVETYVHELDRDGFRLNVRRVTPMNDKWDYYECGVQVPFAEHSRLAHRAERILSEITDKNAHEACKERAIAAALELAKTNLAIIKAFQVG